jgi:hypothetical protein
LGEPALSGIFANASFSNPAIIFWVGEQGEELRGLGIPKVAWANYPTTMFDPWLIEQRTQEAMVTTAIDISELDISSGLIEGFKLPLNKTQETGNAARVEDQDEWPDYKAPESSNVRKIQVRFMPGGVGAPLPPPAFFEDEGE